MNHKKSVFDNALSVHAGWLNLLKPIGEESLIEAIRCNEEGRVNVQDLRSLLYQAYEQNETPIMLAHIADTVESLTFGSFSTALWTARDLDSLLSVLQEYVIVLSAPVRLVYKRDRQGNAELWVLDTESLGNDSKVSYLGITLFIAVVIKIIHKVLSDIKVTLDVCLIEHRYREEENALLEETMHCTIVEGSPIRKLVIPKRFLHIPLTHWDKNLHFSCVNLLREEAERLKKDDLILQIYHFLNQQSHLVDINGRAIADALNMNLRTLNRHLSQQNTSYRGVVEKYKLEKALHLLDAGKVNMTEIAYQLGFSDLSTFSRAFKRWTGVSPMSIRQDTRVKGSLT
ncbi:AraC family transcriptional regulator [Vibrio vulnificus]|uniref:helix-turn-helix domain-containing protein n=1 Tax=Vibrio vulnificus TaxID=672 RepID=UPI00102A3B51|nr:helix-turn-helix transcriptional regulator [Vibrio vulnificus]MDK2600799.1 helix-turn-helix transcriptional regulator [Vibrio vulnificus]MDK2623939.1 helix-turn-helix transcriptional regulator [Vibrio vulnificus]MDK2641018.1 helix-turn-helix transcriptional regulator [Vibrio vulnificus]MDK2667328.1 helix-turn-helix transcriptional regulator [Vibrio vulnificus]MDK2676710.1 helix-turn-helix transcriptional regulator [Vibrio vulnificus]